MNVDTEEGHKEYRERIFTQKGYDTIKTYTQELLKMTHMKYEYPFKIGIVLGLPGFEYSKVINSLDELHERIKAYMHILGLRTLATTLDNGSLVRMSFVVEEEE